MPRPVTLVRYPQEYERLDQLRRCHFPRLLLVEPEADPPRLVNPAEEDWIRYPGDDKDLPARIEAVAQRAKLLHQPDAPTIDDNGILRHASQWICLSEIDSRLARALINQPGTPVTVDQLRRAGWPDNPHVTTNALRVHLVHLRRQLSPMNLRINTVRSIGYLLDFDPELNPRTSL